MTTRTETIRLWQEGTQQDLLDHAAALFGLGPDDAGSPDDFPDMADEFGHPLPLSLRAFLVRDELAHAVCSMYTSIPPLLELADKDIFPRLEGRPVVNIWAEEQGVCLWGVPLDQGPNPAVLASVADAPPPDHYGRPHVYAPSVGHLAVAMAWERVLYAAKPVLHLSSWPDADYRNRLDRAVGTADGLLRLPGDITYRFDGPGGQRMLVWDGGDTHISADDDPTLAALCADLPAGMSDHFDPLGNVEAEAFLSAHHLPFCP